MPVNTRIAVIAVARRRRRGRARRPGAAGRHRATAEETPATPHTAQTQARSPPPSRSRQRQQRRRGRRLRPHVHLAGGRAHAGRAPAGRDQITGTGRGGRVTKKDVQAFIDSGGAQAAAGRSTTCRTSRRPPRSRPRQPAAAAAAPAPPPPRPRPPRPPAAAPAPASPRSLVASGGDEELYQFNTIRKVIARHMRHSLDTAAHVTTVIEVDMTGVVNLRKKWKPEYQKRYGVNLTYIPFIARATIDAIGSWPWVNAEVQGESGADQALRQPGHGRGHRRRQGADGAGHPPRRGDEPGRACRGR